MTDTRGGDAGAPRLPSGVPGLDTILRGGFLRNGVYILLGSPGAGKTILANQIAYSHAARGERTLYVTLLAEQHSRMLLHLRSLTFFDPARIPDAVSYVSGFRTLEEEGLKGLLALLRREVQAQNATLLIVDGLVVAENQATSETEFKKFIHELQAQAMLTACTTFLLTSGQGAMTAPEHTMVDGMLELRDELYEAYAERALEVRKFRGSDFLRGRHAFRIGDDGLLVFPRIESLYAAPSGPARMPKERLSTGIDEIDAMLSGGFRASTTTGIVGASGVGKTTFGLHFLSLSSAAEPGLLFGFFETPERLVAQARQLKLGFAEAAERGDVEIVWQGPTERILDELGHRLLEAVRRRGVRRLFVDGVGGFVHPVTQPSRISRYFAALANELRALDVTTVYTMETRELVGPTVEVPIDGVSSLVENLILLRYVEHRGVVRRLLSIMKSRNSHFDARLRELLVTDRGLALGQGFEEAEELLTGTARSSAGSAAAPRRRRPRSSSGD